MLGYQAAPVPGPRPGVPPATFAGTPHANLSHPGLPQMPVLPLMPLPAPGLIPGLPGVAAPGVLPLAAPGVLPGMPPIVVAAVVMPNGGTPQLTQQKRMRSTAPPLTAEEALHAAAVEGLTLHAAPSTKTGYKGAPTVADPDAAPNLLHASARVQRACLHASVTDVARPAPVCAGVSRGGKSAKKPFQAVRGAHSL